MGYSQGKQIRAESLGRLAMSEWQQYQTLQDLYSICIDVDIIGSSELLGDGYFQLKAREQQIDWGCRLKIECIYVGLLPSARVRLDLD